MVLLFVLIFSGKMVIINLKKILQNFAKKSEKTIDKQLFMRYNNQAVENHI